MEKNGYRRNARAMIYLVACALNGKKPDAGKLAGFDLPELLTVCQDHILTACAAYALESAGIADAQFKMEKEKAIRKNVLLDAERRKLLRKMEQAHIWYLPLKGAVMKDWYPKLGMRQMSDNDILCDSTKMQEVHDIFIAEGYVCEEFGEGNHDVYCKKPVMNFEMHSSLFGEKYLHMKHISRTFANIKERLLPAEGSEYGFRFTNEDFYLYFLAHEYKHFSHGGTGVRALADTYVFLRRFGDTLDWDALRVSLAQLGLTEYEQKQRALAMKLFALKKLTAEEKHLLDYYIFSGVYGNAQNVLKNNYERHGNDSRFRYLYYRFFPSYEFLQLSVPWVRKSRLLIPAAWCYRLFRLLAARRNVIRTEYGFLKEKQGP